ncbi:MAG: hypothetical protein E5X65_32370 [Mesorhizobium sp.]|nr:MAG: hypothetical protein E5X65_32370 [Mesorhizobium sp.]
MKHKERFPYKRRLVDVPSIKRGKRDDAPEQPGNRATAREGSKPMAPKEKFKFKIENENYEWDNQSITGAEVRGVGPGIPDSMDLYVKMRGQPGRLVARGDSIDLRQPGIEKFYAQDASSEAGNG